MKDKNGKEVSGKEFMKRWVEGMKAITPLQQTKISLWSNLLVVVGILIGLYSTFILKTWWLFIILLGSLFLVLIQILGLWQKYMALKEVNKFMEEQEKDTFECPSAQLV